MTTTDRTGTAVPRRSLLGRATALQLAATEYARYLALLRSLEPADWSRATDCPGWDVRTMATHNLGMAEMAASLPQLVGQFAASTRRKEVGVDALTAHQVEARRALAPADIIDRYARVLPKAVRGRGRRSALVGRVRLPEKQTTNGVQESWTFGYLFETILTRDTWMHRADTAAATGRPLLLTSDHDGALMADFVAEWAARHRAPFRLHLNGPAGGHWSVGSGGEEIEVDAVLFARTLSGRTPGTGLLAVQIPF